MLDLNSKGFCIFGSPDGGKSTLANYLLKPSGAGAIVYDTLNEFPDSPFDRYVPDSRYDSSELELVTRNILAARRYTLFVIDECNRFCPPKPAPLPQAIADLNDWRAHYNLTVGFIARRPVQLNQDLTELAHYLFIFRLTGKNDIAYLNDLSRGLGDAVSLLPPYYFIVKSPDGSFEVYEPVPADNATDKKLTP